MKPTVGSRGPVGWKKTWGRFPFAMRPSPMASPGKIPEILAPAGGPEAFLAALNAGADAVYLGLSSHNARSRAVNFSIEDLSTLVPLARRYRMKVLVTVNVVLKSAEMEGLCALLAALEPIGVHALIVQDLGVAAFLRNTFPSFRLHASTQMAIHNLAGVRAAAAMGLRRVVLARELTHPEIRRIRFGAPDVELETFCHGSLCYAYSGLCLFAGAKDARSGNRGECTYACREPWRIESEPGQGFLFSMKDLDTSAEVPRWLDLGIDALKIEGRKKDAQYVAAAVALYRNALDKAAGRSTLRAEAPGAAREVLHGELWKGRGYTFQRAPTTFHFVGRYHENVIDLDEPSHRGVRAGKVLAAEGGRLRIHTEVPLSKHDGLRIEAPAALYHSAPQHGAEVSGTMDDLEDRYQAQGLRMALGDMWQDGRPVYTCGANTLVEISYVPGRFDPAPGHVVYKTRSDEMRTAVEPLTHAPPDERLRPLDPVHVEIHTGPVGEAGVPLTVRVTGLGGLFAEGTLYLAPEKPKAPQNLAADFKEAFGIFGESGHEAVTWNAPDSLHFFVPRSRLKALKKELVQKMSGQATARITDRTQSARRSLPSPRPAPARGPATYSVKFDRAEYLAHLVRWNDLTGGAPLADLVLEPKRMFLRNEEPRAFLESWFAACRHLGATPRLSLPTVVRAWDEIFARKWTQAFVAAGGRHFEVGNVGGWELLREWTGGVDIDLATDQYLYALHAGAAAFFASKGARLITLSVEQDAVDQEHLLARWPWDVAEPQAILFKDVPLFLAEACSLTALHGGCPGSKTCGYRTLHIVSRTGEKYQVAHEECKSVVYGLDSWYLGHLRARHEAMGIRRFRLDFLTRAYGQDRFEEVIRAATRGEVLAGTHTGPFLQRLL